MWVNIDDVSAELPCAFYQRMVCEMAELLKLGFKFPPIACRRHGARFIVSDGHHRYFAALLAGEKTIEIN
jgi:hypothetical protein